MTERDDNAVLSTIPKIGRPKKFETVEELESRIQAYFDSCFVPRTERIKVRNDDDDGYDFVDSYVKNKNGEQLYDRVRPFTVTGLAVALDTTRETLLDYENKPENAAFSDTIKKAKQIIHMFAEERLYAPTQVTGAIFNLKNNFGWVDRTETDLTTKGKAISSAAVSENAADILRTDNDAPPDDAQPEAHDQQG